MTSIITELVYIFVRGPAEGRLLVREFLLTLKTHWWPSAVVSASSMVRVVVALTHSPFPFSILYIVHVMEFVDIVLV